MLRERGRGGWGTVKNDASDAREDQRHEGLNAAGEEAEGQSENEPPLIRRGVGKQATVRTPSNTEGRPKRLLGFDNGRGLTHVTAAAGADSRVCIASITACVEISFIGWGGCLGRKSVMGPG